MTKKKGLYVSYNEEKNGAFDEAVRISNEFGCVTWFDNSVINPEQLQGPTEIFIRLTGQERYFRGMLLAMAPFHSLQPGFADGERNHRPSGWNHNDFKTALFISQLKEETSRPIELGTLNPPQRPSLVDLLATRAVAFKTLLG